MSQFQQDRAGYWAGRVEGAALTAVFVSIARRIFGGLLQTIDSSIHKDVAI
jgi:hypothetical protein